MVGWGLRPTRIFEYRGGWGFKNGHFGAYVLYGWPIYKMDQTFPYEPESVLFVFTWFMTFCIFQAFSLVLEAIVSYVKKAFTLCLSED